MGKLQLERNKAIFAAYQAGESINVLKKRFGLSRQRIYQIVRFMVLQSTEVLRPRLVDFPRRMPPGLPRTGGRGRKGVGRVL